MNGLGLLIVLIGLLAPVAWLISESSPRRWVRVTWGILAIVVSCGLTLLGTIVINTFSYNSYYGFSSQRLINTTITEIEAGRTEAVVAELKRLREEFHPTYENRGRYDQLVEQTVARMKGPEATTQPAR